MDRQMQSIRIGNGQDVADAFDTGKGGQAGKSDWGSAKNDQNARAMLDKGSA